MAITISPVGRSPFTTPPFTGDAVNNISQMLWPDNLPGGLSPVLRRQTLGGYQMVPGMTNKWTAPSRAIGTIYQNTSGYPLAVAITLVASTSNFLTFYLLGTPAVYNPYFGGGGGTYMLCTILHVGSYYSVGPDHPVQSWYELVIA